MKKIQRWLSPVMFCLVLFGLSALLLFGNNREYSQTEKRFLTQMPQWSWKAVQDGSFQKQLEDWTADQFPARDLWVGIHSYAQLLTGRASLQEIYFCKNDYLISAPASQDLSVFQTNLERFDAFAEECEVPVSMMMVPSAGWLKEDLLPAGHLIYPDEKQYALAEEVVRHMTMIDPREALNHADALRPVQYRTDHHLTAYGNYVLSSCWWQHQGLPVIPEESYRIEAVNSFYGSTWSGSGYRLTEADTLELWDCGVPVRVTVTDPGKEEIVSDSLFFREHLSQLDQYPVYLDGNHCQTVIENSQGTEGTLLILKDSYAHCFATLLAERYEKIILMDLRYYRGEVSKLIETYAVDQVLFLYGTSTLLTDTNSAWLF